MIKAQISGSAVAQIAFCSLITACFQFCRQDYYGHQGLQAVSSLAAMMRDGHCNADLVDAEPVSLEQLNLALQSQDITRLQD